MGRLYEDYDSETLVNGYSIYQLANIVCKGISNDAQKDIVDSYLYWRIEDIEREFLGTEIRTLPLSFNRVGAIRGCLINANRNSEYIYDAYNISNGFCEEQIFDKDNELLVRIAIEALIIQIKRQRDTYRNNKEKLGVQAMLPEEKRNYFNIDRIERVEYVRKNISEIIEYIESRIKKGDSLFLPTENKLSGHREILVPISGHIIYTLADYSTLELLRNLRRDEDYDNAFGPLFVRKTK